jgi:hypothetical protein
MGGTLAFAISPESLESQKPYRGFPPMDADHALALDCVDPRESAV